MVNGNTMVEVLYDKGCRLLCELLFVRRTRENLYSWNMGLEEYFHDNKTSCG